MAFTPNERCDAPDPVTRDIGAVTAEISLADEAEYSLGKVSYGQYEARYVQDERPRRVRFNVQAKADIVFSALSKSTTVITATVASGAGEAIQIGQWLNLQPTASNANATILRGYFIVADKTATTIILTHGTSGTVSDVGAGVAKSDAIVWPEASQSCVLWDSIIIADNQDENLGKLERGIYTVEFLDTIAAAGVFFSDGTVLSEYMEENSTDEENVKVTDATSNTVTALFVSSGDVLLRNGADIAAKIRVTFTPHMHCGVDQDGSLCFYAKSEALRLKNRLGLTKSFELARVG